MGNLGAAYGTAKSGVGISSMGVMRPDMVMRSIIPVVMAGGLGIHGLITSVIINGKITKGTYSSFWLCSLCSWNDSRHVVIGSGPCDWCGRDAGVRANALQPK